MTNVKNDYGKRKIKQMRRLRLETHNFKVIIKAQYLGLCQIPLLWEGRGTLSNGYYSITYECTTNFHITPTAHSLILESKTQKHKQPSQ